jgi:hypothetical protein
LAMTRRRFRYVARNIEPETGPAAAPRPSARGAHLRFQATASYRQPRASRPKAGAAAPQARPGLRPGGRGCAVTLRTDGGSSSP